MTSSKSQQVRRSKLSPDVRKYRKKEMNKKNFRDQVPFGWKVCNIDGLIYVQSVKVNSNRRRLLRSDECPLRTVESHESEVGRRTAAEKRIEFSLAEDKRRSGPFVSHARKQK